MTDIKIRETGAVADAPFLSEEEVRQGFIVQHHGSQDRRQRLLELTDKGHELERQLSEPQRDRVGAAYRKAGAQAVDGFRKVLLAIIAAEEDRRRFGRR